MQLVPGAKELFMLKRLYSCFEDPLTNVPQCVLSLVEPTPKLVQEVSDGSKLAEHVSVTCPVVVSVICS